MWRIDIPRGIDLQDSCCRLPNTNNSKNLNKNKSDECPESKNFCRGADEDIPANGIDANAKMAPPIYINPRANGFVDGHLKLP